LVFAKGVVGKNLNQLYFFTHTKTPLAVKPKVISVMPVVFAG
jgi:hypothetical protein